MNSKWNLSVPLLLFRQLRSTILNINKETGKRKEKIKYKSVPSDLLSLSAC